MDIYPNFRYSLSYKTATNSILSKKIEIGKIFFSKILALGGPPRGTRISAPRSNIENRLDKASFYAKIVNYAKFQVITTSRLVWAGPGYEKRPAHLII